MQRNAEKGACKTPLFFLCEPLRRRVSASSPPLFNRFLGGRGGGVVEGGGVVACRTPKSGFKGRSHTFLLESGRLEIGGLAQLRIAPAPLCG